jgi:hypothetical protein
VPLRGVDGRNEGGTVATTTELAPDAEPSDATAFDLSMPARVVLASLSAAAGAIHLVMAPIHASSSSIEAFAFAGAGWFQLAFAGFILARPNKAWLQVAVVANIVFIGAWVLSRTVGLPFGDHPGTAEAVGTIDTVTVTFQVLLIAMAAVAIVHPRVLSDLPAPALAIGAGIPLAILVAATLVVVSPSTATHSHDEGEETAAAPTAELAATTTRCDASLNPVAYWEEAKLAGTDGVTPVAAAPASSGGHAHGAAAAPADTSTPTTPTTLGPLKGRGSQQLDKLISLSGQEGEAAAGFLIAEMANATDDEYHEFIASLNPANKPDDHGAEASGNASDATQHTMSHLGPQEWKPMTDQADCDAVAAELERTKAVTVKYPTAADAKAAGYVRVAPYVPGIASHWMKFAFVDGVFNVDEPEMLLYDGNGDGSHIAGVSYYVVMQGDTQPSQGFTGDNDLYHRHIGLCSAPKGGVIGDSTTTDEECAAMGGRKNNGGAGWMSHAWVVPGCESPWGVFSGINPLLDKATGDASGTNDGGCAASAVRDRYNLDAATTETMPTTTAVPAETEQAAGN